MLNLYKKNGATIFPSKPLKTLQGVFGAIYEPQPIEKVLEKPSPTS
jgi:hypothetical protein